MPAGNLTSLLLCATSLVLGFVCAPAIIKCARARVFGWRLTWYMALVLVVVTCFIDALRIEALIQ